MRCFHQKSHMLKNFRNTVRLYVNISEWGGMYGDDGLDSQKVFHEAGFDAYCVGFGE